VLHHPAQDAHDIEESKAELARRMQGLSEAHCGFQKTKTSTGMCERAHITQTS
jgi:hypothetical protein